MSSLTSLPLEILARISIPYTSIVALYVLGAMRGHRYEVRHLPNNLDTPQASFNAAVEKATGEEKVRLLRAKSASANLFENIPLFIATVFASQLSGVSETAQNTYAIVFVVSRALYRRYYIAGQGQLRALSYLVGLVGSVGMLFYSGALLQRKIL